jgi:hypothetical protein
LRKKPITNNIKIRKKFFQLGGFLMLTERGTAIPRINIKVGKTKSDGVSPFH